MKESEKLNASPAPEADSTGTVPSDAELLQVLLHGTPAERLDVQSAIVRRASTAGTVEFDWSIVEEKDMVQIFASLQKDMTGPKSSSEVLHNSVSIASLIMSRSYIVDLLPLSYHDEMAKTLIQVVKKENDKKIVSRVLWGFAKEKYPIAVYHKHCDELIDIIVDALNEKQSLVIVTEGLKVLLILLKTSSRMVVDRAVDFYSEIFPQLFHGNTQVRRLSLKCTQALLDQPDSVEVLSAVVKKAVPEIKASYSKVLCTLMDDGQCALESLIIWQVCVKLLGRQLHSGTTLINSLLSVIERGFKSPESLVRIEAFQSWSCLIDNFRLEKSVLCSNKRLRLLMAPFLANNAKNEEIADAKLTSWWHLLCSVDSHIVENNFDMLVVPLLQLCFKAPIVSTSPKSASLVAKHLSSTSSVATSFSKKMHLKLVHVLFYLLKRENANSLLPPDGGLEPLLRPVMSATHYSKHHSLINTSFHEVLHVIVKLKCDSMLLGEISESLISLLGEQLKNPNSREGAESLKGLYDILKSCSIECCAEAPDQNEEVAKALNSTLLQVINSMVSGGSAFPLAVLSSRHYHVGGAGVNLMRGTLASSLLDFLFLPSVFCRAASSDCYFALLENLFASYQTDGLSRLAFIEGASSGLAGCLSTAAISLASAELTGKDSCHFGSPSQTADVASKIWIIIAKALQASIEETGTIDNGDGSEHDFSSVYSVLLLPLQHTSTLLSDLQQVQLKALLDQWCGVYRCFARLAHLSLAPPNCTAQHISKLLSETLQRLSGPPDLHGNVLVFFCGLAACCASVFCYSKLITSVRDGPGGRKKAHNLQELEGLTAVVVELSARVLRMVGQQRQATARHLTAALSALLGGPKQAKLIVALLVALLGTFTDIVAVNPSVRYGHEIALEIIKAFEMYCTLIEEHRVLSSADASKVVPLVQKALESTHTAIVQKIFRLWNNSDKKALPENLVAETNKIAARQNLSLPTRVSESLLPQSRAADVGSPATTPKGKRHSAIASFGKPSPKVYSPARKMAAPSARLNTLIEKKSTAILPLDDDDVEFVAINSPVGGRKRILTPHQREKLQERRCDIPALYSDLSQQASQSFLDPTFNSSSKDNESQSCFATEERDSTKNTLETEAKKEETTVDQPKEIAPVEDPKNLPTSSGINLLEIFSKLEDKETSLPTEDKKKLSTLKNGNSALSETERIDNVGSIINRSSNESEIRNGCENSDSDDEIPDSQAGEIDDQIKRKSIFSGLASQALGSFRCSPKITSSIDGVEPLVPGSTRTSQRKSIKSSDEHATLTRYSSKSITPNKLLDDRKDSVNDELPPPTDNSEVNEVENIDACTSSRDLSVQIQSKVCPLNLRSTPSKLKDIPCEKKATPSKITRSGRKIVPPKKDMPEPMTPPGLTSCSKKYAVVKMGPLAPSTSAKTVGATLDVSADNEKSDEANTAQQTRSLKSHDDNSLKKSVPVKNIQKKITDVFASLSDRKAASPSTDSRVISEVENGKELTLTTETRNPKSYSRRSVASASEVAFAELTQHQDVGGKSSAIDPKNKTNCSKPNNELQTKPVPTAILIDEMHSGLANEKSNDNDVLSEASLNNDKNQDPEVINATSVPSEVIDAFALEERIKPSHEVEEQVREKLIDDEEINSEMIERSNDSDRPVTSDNQSSASASASRTRSKRVRKSVNELQNSLAVRSKRGRLVKPIESSDQGYGVQSEESSSVLDSDDETLSSKRLKSGDKIDATISSIKEISVPKLSRDDSTSVILGKSPDKNPTITEASCDNPSSNSDSSSFLSSSMETSDKDSSQSSLVCDAAVENPVLTKSTSEENDMSASNIQPAVGKRGSKRLRMHENTNDDSPAKRRNTRSLTDSVKNTVGVNDQNKLRSSRSRGSHRSTRANSARSEPSDESDNAFDNEKINASRKKVPESQEIGDISKPSETFVSEQKSNITPKEKDVDHELFREQGAIINLNSHQSSAGGKETLEESMELCVQEGEGPASTEKDLRKLDSSTQKTSECKLGEEASTSDERTTGKDHNINAFVETKLTELESPMLHSSDGDIPKDNTEECSIATNYTKSQTDEPSAELRVEPQNTLDCHVATAETEVDADKPIDPPTSVKPDDRSSPDALELINSASKTLPASPSSVTRTNKRCRSTEVTSERRRNVNVRSLSGGSRSRAALMVACAQRNRHASSPVTSATPARKMIIGSSSDECSPPIRDLSEAVHTSAQFTPPTGKRLQLTVTPHSERLWPRHRPSPAASPGGSILKKPLTDSGTKGRRVSFADPPVSDSVVIHKDESRDHSSSPRVSEAPTNESKVPLSVRAQKRLDMSRAASLSAVVQIGPSKLTKIVHPSTLPQLPSQKSLALLVENGGDTKLDEEEEDDDLSAMSCSQGIYSSLAGCSAPLACLLPYLTSPSLICSLEAVLRHRGLTSVGHVASLTEGDLTSLPIKPPKLQNTVAALKLFEQNASVESGKVLLEEPAERPERESSESELWGLTGEGPSAAAMAVEDPVTENEDNTLGKLNETSTLNKEYVPTRDGVEITSRSSDESATHNYGDSAIRDDQVDDQELNSEKSFGVDPTTDPIITLSDRQSREEDVVLSNSETGPLVDSNMETEETSDKMENKVVTMDMDSEDDAMLSGTETVHVDSTALAETQGENSDKENSSPERKSSQNETSSDSSLGRSAVSVSKWRDPVSLARQDRSEGPRQVLAELPIGLDVPSDEENEEASPDLNEDVTQDSSAGTIAESTPINNSGATTPIATPSSDLSEEQLVSWMRALPPERKKAALAAVLSTLEYSEVLESFFHYLRQRE
ncbi:telomere-associated protein RIF1 [Hyalella azteca]|uniref:Telomere-associated protein RIF1 n=1 Tax=Hyalella azteca TaxID=294128 RepID=A0A8B7N678_HYAAZ|nr:telomere-associated protein RIF1 [Hyalella azteca]